MLCAYTMQSDPGIPVTGDGGLSPIRASSRLQELIAELAMEADLVVSNSIEVSAENQELREELTSLRGMPQDNSELESSKLASTLRCATIGDSKPTFGALSHSNKTTPRQTNTTPGQLNATPRQETPRKATPRQTTTTPRQGNEVRKPAHRHGVMSRQMSSGVTNAARTKFDMILGTRSDPLTAERLCEMMVNHKECPSGLEGVQAILDTLRDQVGADNTDQNSSTMNINMYLLLMGGFNVHGCEAYAADIQNMQGTLEREFEMQQMMSWLAVKDRRLTPPLRTPLIDSLIEVTSTVMILGNALAIGINTDIEYEAKESVNMIFNVYFAVEFIALVYRNGVRKSLCGNMWKWTYFDFVVVLLGLADIAIIVTDTNLDGVDPKMFTMIRLVRLSRITRIIRVLKLDFFQELVMMLNGMMAGVRTIMWVIFLLVFLIYILSICLVNAVGSGKGVPPHVSSDMTGSIPNAAFTIFRCCMGDCSTDTGLPLSHTLYAHMDNGWVFALIYFVFMVYFMFGILSLVISVITENMLEAAASDAKKLRASDPDKKRVAMCMIRLTNKLQELHRDGCFSTASPTVEVHNVTGKAQVPEPLKLVTKAIFATALEGSEVNRLLDDIGIDGFDRLDLFDAMDADGDGALGLQELVKGLIRMRGEPKKADTVMSRLVVRSLQREFQGFHEKWEHRASGLDSILADSTISTDCRTVAATSGSKNIAAAPAESVTHAVLPPVLREVGQFHL